MAKNNISKAGDGIKVILALIFYSMRQLYETATINKYTVDDRILLEYFYKNMNE